MHGCRNIAPAFLFHNLQGCDIDATAASKTVCCWRGLACLIKGAAGWWPFYDRFQINLTACQLGDENHQTPGRSVDLNSVIVQAQFCEQRRHGRAELCEGCRDISSW
jgi:hypothetical protein